MAAGSSSRLGRPKQLLSFRGTTLLQHTIDQAKIIDVGPVVLVTGAFHEKIFEETNTQGLNVVHNDFWQDGMTSSIICGLKKAINLSPEIDAAIILMCDQPFLSSSVLLEMIEAYMSTGKEIIQCKYGDNYGPPVLFDQSLFTSIMALTDKNGARNIIRQHPEKVAFVSFPDGCIDIDTDADFEKLNHGRISG